MTRILKKIITAALIILMFSACRLLDTYTLTVTATAETISGRDVNGQAVYLTPCKAENGKTILLDNVQPGRRYTVLIDTCGTWCDDDDNILKIQEAEKMKKFYNFETMFSGLKNGLIELLKTNNIYYEISDGRGPYDIAMVWHFEILAGPADVELINAWIDENTITIQEA